ncbi:hypothetical protein RQP46_006395 [Phenoliferia psychrophenolica]
MNTTLSSLSLNSPSRGQSLRDTIHKSAHQPKKTLTSSAALAALAPSKKRASPSKKRSASPTKSIRTGDDVTTLLSSADTTQEYGRTSPTKLAKGLAAGGGLGRMDVVGNDWDGSHDVRKSPSKKGKVLDRYIPSRGNSASGSGEHTGPILVPGSGSANSTQNLSDATDSAHSDLSQSLGLDPNKRILSFFAEPPPAQGDTGLLTTYARRPPKSGHPGASHASSTAAASRRRIATAPERVLDAPGLVDDYYLNLLDWSATNLVAIALAESVYVWNAQSGEVSSLCSVGGDDGHGEGGDEIVCSVKFSEDGGHLAVGLSSGPIRVYDVASSSLVRTMSGHLSRVPSLSWSGAVLSSGCRTGEIWNSDVRVAQHRVAEMKGHRGEVCGLEWRTEVAGGLSGGGQGLLASGGNDNVVNVWDGRMTSAPKMSKTNHTAAVKALAWCPWNPSLLASGGGTNDRTIHFWNATTGARLNSLTTPSQVTSLIWNPHAREILSSHGNPDHQLSIHAYPSLAKVTDIPNAHEARILNSCLSPDGTVVATASSDENLKFWRVFEGKKGGKSGGGGAMAEKDVDAADGIQRKGKTGISVR